jgi:hypothetical protein
MESYRNENVSAHGNRELFICMTQAFQSHREQILVHDFLFV